MKFTNTKIKVDNSFGELTLSDDGMYASFTEKGWDVTLITIGDLKKYS